MRLALLFCSLVCSFQSQAQAIYFPPPHAQGQWETRSPASLGLRADSLAALQTFLAEEQTKSFLLLHDGRIVLEYYFNSFTQDSLWFWFSAGKSLRAVLIGMAQEEGHLAITDKSSDYLGVGWTSLTPTQEDAITVWHQLTMTCGMNPLFFDCTTPDCLRYLAPAGSRWDYHNGPYSLTKKVLEVATGQNHNLYTNSHIEAPLGMSNGFWVDNPATGDSYYLSRARDMARFGLLIQNEGVWNGTPLWTDTTYFNAMLRPSQTLNPSYGYFWWLNGQSSYRAPGSLVSTPGPLAPDGPTDLLLAAGGEGQFISISPAEGWVMVRQGRNADSSLAPIGLHNEIWRRIKSALPTTATQQPANPIAALTIYPNPSETQITFEPPRGAFRCRLYNLAGQLVVQHENKATIPVQMLPSGTYYLHVSSRQGTQVARFVKR